MSARDATMLMILGAAKAGSTSLSRYLDQHPDLLLSSPKEPVFFEAEYEHGIDHYFQTHFGEWSGERVVAEARTHNLMLPFVPERIRASLPEARLIALVRDPIDRAYSHWWHRYSRSLERLEFRGALEENLQRLEQSGRFEGPDATDSWKRNLIRNRTNHTTKLSHYLELGEYAPQIERYRSIFPEPQLLVVFFDELSKDPEATTIEVWKHAGLEPPDHPFDSQIHNAAQARVRGPLSRYLGWATGRVAGALEDTPGLRRAIPNWLTRGVDKALSGKEAVRPAMRPDDEAWLLEYYEPHNRALEALTGHDLSAWRTPQARRTRANAER